MRIAKETHFLIVVTPGHTMTGEVYIPVGAVMASFIESVDPAFIPMTDVRTRSLPDRGIITRYRFALLNAAISRRATEALAGTVAQRTVL